MRSDLEEPGLMALFVVAANDSLGMQPSGQKSPAMLIGEYVRVQIQGHQIEDVYRIPRSVLRYNNQIWLLDADGNLDIREVTIIQKDFENRITQGIISAEESKTYAIPQTTISI